MQKLKALLFILTFYCLFFLVRLSTIFFTIVQLKRWGLKAKKDILFLEAYTLDGAGYNYRVKKWVDLFLKNKIKAQAKVLINESIDFFKLTSQKPYLFIIKTGFIRFFQILKTRNYKTIIVRRSVVLYNPYGNHFFEKLLFAMHPRLILDFDDDIAANQTVNNSKTLFQKIAQENFNYFNTSLKYYNGFIVGSNYLKAQLKKRLITIKDDEICVIPTCVDYEKYPGKIYSKEPEILKFGWIGGNHNLHLLHKIIPALNEISKKKNIELIIICGSDTYPLGAGFPVTFIPYSLNTEAENILKMDIGLMPLNDDNVSKGKCGFKLIQYMGLGIPGLASAVTVNNEIVDDGINGWLVYDDREWISKLNQILESINELDKFGEKARKKVIENYSFSANYYHYEQFLFPKIDKNV